MRFRVVRGRISIRQEMPNHSIFLSLLALLSRTFPDPNGSWLKNNKKRNENKTVVVVDFCCCSALETIFFCFVSSTGSVVRLSVNRRTCPNTNWCHVFSPLVQTSMQKALVLIRRRRGITQTVCARFPSVNPKKGS